MKEINIADSPTFFVMQIRETLRTVLDPELNINIIDLGLVYDIEVELVQKLIGITMTLSSRYCPMGEAILQSVRNCLEQHYSGFEIAVHLTWEPQWSYESISEEGLKQLRG